MVLHNATFECERCEFRMNYFHGPFSEYCEISYEDEKGLWHDVSDGCMLVVSSEPVKGDNRMWWQRKTKSLCLRCGKQMHEMFKDGPEQCDVCGFAKILNNGKLSYRIKDKQSWIQVPNGFLLVIASEEET